MTANGVKQLSVYEAIHRRRMAWKFEDRSGAGVHYRYYAGRCGLGAQPPAYRTLAVLRPGPRLSGPAGGGRNGQQTVLNRGGDERRADAGPRQDLDAPCLMYVYCVPGQDEAATKENYAAVCCAVQNMALAGVSEGVAVTWETAASPGQEGIPELLGADPAWDLVTILFIGYPDEHPRSCRTPVTRFVQWYKRRTGRSSASGPAKSPTQVIFPPRLGASGPGMLCRAWTSFVPRWFPVGNVLALAGRPQDCCGWEFPPRRFSRSPLN